MTRETPTRTNLEEGDDLVAIGVSRRRIPDLCKRVADVEKRLDEADQRLAVAETRGEEAASNVLIILTRLDRLDRAQRADRLAIERDRPRPSLWRRLWPSKERPE